MDEKKVKYVEPLFPAPYEHFEDLIANDLRLRKELEEELKKVKQNYQPPKSYKLELHPLGIENSRQNKNYAGAIEKLEYQIKDTDNRIAKTIGRECTKLDLDKGQVKIIDNVVFEKMFPDPFKGLGVHEKKAYNRKPKDIDESQRVMYYDIKRMRESLPNKNSKKDFSLNRE